VRSRLRRITELKEQVRRTEIAFAKTLADRDSRAFASFISDEAVFLTNASASRGVSHVVEAWKGCFQGP
jgi:hypothetical protein